MFPQIKQVGKWVVRYYTGGETKSTYRPTIELWLLVEQLFGWFHLTLHTSTVDRQP